MFPYRIPEQKELTVYDRLIAPEMKRVSELRLSYEKEVREGTVKPYKLSLFEYIEMYLVNPKWDDIRSELEKNWQKGGK